MERGLLEVRNNLFPLVDKTASYIYQYLETWSGNERIRLHNNIVSNLIKVKFWLLNKDSSDYGNTVERSAIEVDSDFVSGLMDNLHLNHKFDVDDLLKDLLIDFKTLNPNCEINNEEGLSKEELEVNRGKFRKQVVTFIDLLVEELEPETHLNLEQIERVNAISTKFLSTIDSGSKEEGLLKRRSRLSQVLLTCASMFRSNDQSSGGVIERTLDKDFQYYVGAEPVFEIKRAAFPSGSEYSELKATLDSSRNIEGEIKVGEVLVVFDDLAKIVVGFEVTGVEEDRIITRKLTIESKRKGPESYYSFNVPEYVVTRTDSKGEDIIVEINKNISGKSFDNIDKLLEFLFEIDQRRYGVYTYMCRYFVSNLRNRIRKEGYKLVHNEK